MPGVLSGCCFNENSIQIIMSKIKTYMLFQNRFRLEAGIMFKVYVVLTTVGFALSTYKRSSRQTEAEGGSVVRGTD